jgi:hypothetical protein
VVAEQAEGSEHDVPAASSEGRARTRTQRIERPSRIAASAAPVGEVGDDDRGAGLVAVQARAFVALSLEHLEVVSSFGGGGDQVQHSMLVGQQQT